MQGMIFAAGLGTRLKPLTLSKPKALVEVNGISLLERNIKKMNDYGIKHIVINVHHFADMMKEEISHLKDKYKLELIVSDESAALLDTGGGLVYAKDLFIENEPILIHNVDILSDIDFGDLENKFLASDSVAMLCCKKRKTSRYFIFDKQNLLCGWTNTLTGQTITKGDYSSGTFLAFSGVQIVSTDIFDKIKRKGVFSIVNVYLDLCINNNIIPYIHEGMWLDVGKLDSLNKAEHLFQAR